MTSPPPRTFSGASNNGPQIKCRFETTIVRNSPRDAYLLGTYSRYLWGRWPGVSVVHCEW